MFGLRDGLQGVIGQLGVGEGAVVTAGRHRVVGVERELVVHVEHGDVLVGAADQLLHLGLRWIHAICGLSQCKAGGQKSRDQCQDKGNLSHRNLHSWFLRSPDLCLLNYFTDSAFGKVQVPSTISLRGW